MCRTVCIELGKRGYRSGEPIGVERETSSILAQVLTALWSKKLTKNEIADALRIPMGELESLIFGLAGPGRPHLSAGRMSLVS